MAKKGEALTPRRPAQRGATSAAAMSPAIRSVKTHGSAPSRTDPFNRLVVACVGVATLAAAAGTAWRDGHGAPQASGATAHSLISGLEVDFAAGAAALAVGLWLAARHRRRSSANMAAVVEGLTRLAGDPEPDRLTPLDLGGNLPELTAAYNNALAGLGRWERQVSIHAMAKAEQRRLAELAMLRQDISAPLATAKTLPQDLVRAGEAPELARRYRRIADALARIGESVLATLDDLIDRPHASPTNFHLQSAPVDLAELTEDIATLLWAQAAAKGLDLAVYIDPQTPLTVQGDAVRLRQVIGGLASAALAVTQEGGVLIEVEPDSPTSVRISIHDTGPALARPSDGSGADVVALQTEARSGDPDGVFPARLATYRQMVQAMGGAFAAPARRDRGATFAFRLPSPAGAAAAPWTVAVSASASAGRPDAASSAARVLVAVRGACTRRALSRYLARSGLAVSVYEGGEPAADARLLIGDAAGLKAVGPLDIPVIRLVAPQDVAPPPSHAGAHSAILSQPLCRAELETLLGRFISGQPVQMAASADGALADARRPSAPFPGASPTALTDDERALLADLERAAEREELSLAYQPQVDRESERIVGVEALLRWDHPTRGPVSPSIFIPLAERSGKIAAVTSWVIDRVLAETQYLTGLQVSFNASALEFAQRGFVDRLLAAVAETGYDARRLEVEITETAILHHETPVRESMDRLHAVGIGVALDDFGAGYSSLSHLRRYPFDKLKIDREFITDCSRDMESATVVHAVVSIGRALGMKVIAEGVETQTQRNFLRIAGVYAMQGFLFGKPVPIDNLAPLLSANRAQARV